jgi:selenocysteine-specific elongation factor
VTTHRLVLGVIGHVNHGKSALVRTLTGIDTDRLAEEKRRGMSIALGYAHLSLERDTIVDLIDMPGHERFVRTMIAGATGIDAVLLVVAANEGIKPQTNEHIAIASLLGLRQAIVAISKSDLVAADEAKRVGCDVVQQLVAAGLEPLPPILTSTLDSRGLSELRESFSRLNPTRGPHARAGTAFLPIDRAFSMIGHGPVVTGTLRGAAVSVGGRLELFPRLLPIRVRAIQVRGAPVETADPGQRVALNVRDVELAELQRGMVLAAPGTVEPSTWLTLSIRSVGTAPPLRNGMKLRALFGTSELEARLRLLDRDVLEPGQSGFAQLRFDESVASSAHEYVMLRLLSPAQTVAGGKILEPVTQRLKRHCARSRDRLEDLRTLAPSDLLRVELQRAAAAGTPLRQLARLTALSEAMVTELLQPLAAIVTRSGWVVCAADLTTQEARIASLLPAHLTGLTRDKLLAALPETSGAVLDEALARLVARGVVREHGQLFLIPRPDEELARARTEAELAAQLGELLQQKGLTPPNPGELLTSVSAKRAVDSLLRRGLVVRAVDRAKGRELLFHRDAIAEAQQRLRPLLARGPGLLVTEIASALGITRKFCMPLLDHLDMIHFTRRVGDRRVAGHARK